jgi:drug/metabolite transporter (DMT)-like permease
MMKKTHLSISLLAIIWASTWLAIKVGLGDIPPFHFAAMRFIIASAVLLPFALKAGKRGLRFSPFMIILTGLIVIPIPYAIVYWGAQYISSGLTAVLFSTMPIFIALFSIWLLPDEKLSGPAGLGLAIGFLGILLIFLDDIMLEGERSSMGVAACLIGTITSSLGVVLIKRNSARYDPLSLTAVHFLIGAVFLIVLSMFTEEWSEVNFTISSVLSLFYLALFGSSIAFALYYWLLTKMDVNRVSLLVYVTPVIAVYLGWVFLKEVITLQVAIGTALVFAGIKLATSDRRTGSAEFDSDSSRI